MADRVNRLPPYMFGKINKLKYQKRVAGVDVIDLGMGNPTDAPDPLIVDKLSEALADPRNHRYSVSNGIENLRKEVSARYWKKYGVRLAPDTEVIACLGSKEGFSHMCLALMGPGDTAIVPAPSFPIHVYAVMLASGNVIALDVRKPDDVLAERRLHLRAPLSEAESGHRQLSAQPEHDGRRAGLLTSIWSRWPRNTAFW